MKRSLTILLTSVAMLIGASSIALASEAKPYSISFTSKDAVQVGKAEQCELTITPAKGHVLKAVTPFKGKLSAPASLELAQDTLAAKDFVDPETAAKTILTKFTAKQSGEASIQAELEFFICNDTLCPRFKDTVNCPVKAE